MRCAFPACDHDSSQISSRRVTFHRLPDEESLRAAWMEALGQTDWTPEPGSVVCSEHILVMDLLGTSTEHPLQITKDLIISELQNYDAISSYPADNSNEGHFEFDIEDLDDGNKQTDARLDESPEDVKFTVDQNYIFGEDETIYVAKDEFKTENEGMNVIEESHLEDVVCDSTKEDSDIVNLPVKLENSTRLDESPEDVKFTVDQNYIYGEEETIYVAKDEFKTENEGFNSIEESHLDVVCDSIKGNSDIVNVTVKLENSEVIDKESPSAEQAASHMASTGEDVLGDLPKLEDEEVSKTRRVVNEVEVDEQQTPKADGSSTDDALLCDICHYETDSDIQLLEHLKAHATSNNVRQRKRNLQTHPLKHSPEKSYICDACKKVFRKKITLRRHVRIHSNEKPYSCDICNKRFSLKGNLKCHQSTHSNERPYYSCNVCNKGFRQKLGLKYHQLVHSNERPYSCNVCDKGFKNKQQLKTHQLIHSNERPYSCDVCNKRFRQKGTLKKHLLIHSNERPYSCDVCNKRFRQKGTLKKHLLIHCNERPYSCNVCNKGFRQKVGLKHHQLMHSNERPYTCNVCNKGFTRECHLKNHLLIHSNERPYSCNVCDKGFRKKIDLKMHLLIHSNVKPHSCDVCNKVFKQKKHLKSHQLIHSNEKPFSCDVCNKVFRHKQHLKSHQLIHSKEKPLSCDVCNTAFRFKVTLRTHKCNNIS